MGLREKVIVITGGSSGIGKATAALCAQKGANLALVAHGREKLDTAQKEIAPLLRGGKLKTYLCDISDAGQVESTVTKILTDFGKVDVLINNAGYAVYKTYAELSLDEIDHITRVNYLGALYVCKEVLDRMMLRGEGHVINVGSIAGRIPMTPSSVYSGAKHALTAMTELLEYEYQPFGIRFSLFLPGRVDTPFFDHETFKRRPERLENKGILPVSVAAEALLTTILSQKRQVVIPGRFRVAIWLNAALPWLFKPLIRVIIHKRIVDHYNQVGWPAPRIR